MEFNSYLFHFYSDEERKDFIHRQPHYCMYNIIILFIAKLKEKRKKTQKTLKFYEFRILQNANSSRKLH